MADSDSAEASKRIAMTASPASPVTLAEAFDRFRKSPLERLRVRIRQVRAGQIRQLSSLPEEVTLDQFNKEVWNLETSTRLDGGECKGKLYKALTEVEIGDFSLNATGS
jgi:hypothetical protein